MRQRRLVAWVVGIALALWAIGVLTSLAQPAGGVLVAASGDGDTTRVKLVNFAAYTAPNANGSVLQLVPASLVGTGWNTSLSFNDSGWGATVPANAVALDIWRRYGWLSSVPSGAQARCYYSNCSFSVHPERATTVHRRKFRINAPAGKQVDHIYLYMWSDNKSAWYVNGSLVSTNGQGDIAPVEITGLVTGDGSDNLLAMQVSNDQDNPSGVAWAIYATFVDGPSIQVNVKNPQGTPVRVTRLCYGGGGSLYATPIACASSSSITGAIDTSKLYNGGILETGLGSLIVVGVTPVPGGGYSSSLWGGPLARSYYWRTWPIGRHAVDFIVVSPTPTRTPTPQPTNTPTSTPTPTRTPIPRMVVRVQNPQGTPVARNICKVGGNNLSIQEYSACYTKSSHTFWMSNLTDRLFMGMLIDLGGDVLTGIIGASAGGMLDRWPGGRRDYSWPRWVTGFRQIVFVVASPTPQPTNTPTRTPTPRPTNTLTPRPTNTPTSTPTPTATPLPGGLALRPDYPYLVLYAPNVGMPAQTLRGQLQGWGATNRTITIQVQTPDGTIDTYPVQTDLAGQFTLDPLTAADSYFGTTQTGTWHAVAVYSPAGLSSNTVSWSTGWSPGHLTD